MLSSNKTEDTSAATTQISTHATVADALSPISPTNLNWLTIDGLENLDMGLPALQFLPSIEAVAESIASNDASNASATLESSNAAHASDNSENSSGISSYRGMKRQRFSENISVADSSVSNNLVCALKQQLADAKEETNKLKQLLQESNLRADYYQYAFNTTQRRTNYALANAQVHLQNMSAILGRDDNNQANQSQRFFSAIPQHTSQHRPSSSNSNNSFSSTRSIASTPPMTSSATLTTETAERQPRSHKRVIGP